MDVLNEGIETYNNSLEPHYDEIQHIPSLFAVRTSKLKVS